MNPTKCTYNQFEYTTIIHHHHILHVWDLSGR